MSNIRRKKSSMTRLCPIANTYSTKLSNKNWCLYIYVCGCSGIHQLADVLTGVRHRDLIDLIGIQPDLALAALENRGGEALLKTKRHHPCSMHDTQI